MSGVIAIVEHVTPTWLTDVLTRAGHLTAGKVISATGTRVHDEQLHSISYFLATSYSPDAPATAPAHLFLKLPRPHAPDSWVAAAGAREVKLYRAIERDRGDLPVIPCYDAAYDPDSPGYHLLLADLSATHNQPAWHLTIADLYVTRTVDSLAAFHAYWWGHPRLPIMGDLMSAARRHDEVARLRDTFPEFADALGDRLDAKGRRIYDRLLAALPTLWESDSDPRDRTLLHGDAHFWNFLYPRDPTARDTYMLDWQTYRPGLGVQDLAYTIVLRYPHRTPANERALVGRYHERLQAGGVAHYSWERCWEDYRRSAAEQLVVPLSWRATNGLFVGRALAAFRDLACDEFIP